MLSTGMCTDAKVIASSSADEDFISMKCRDSGFAWSTCNTFSEESNIIRDKIAEI